MSERLGRASIGCAKAAFGVLVVGVLGSILAGWLWIFWAIATNYDGTDFGPISWVSRVIAGSVLVAFALGVVAASLALGADALTATCESKAQPEQAEPNSGDAAHKAGSDG